MPRKMAGDRVDNMSDGYDLQRIQESRARS